ncbi:MAG: hypothetical protein ABSG86_04345 [Thermoguttaceae bacterium]
MVGSQPIANCGPNERLFPMKILNPAPPWGRPRSDYAVLWHGCTAADKDAIEKNGIDRACCAPNSDFGRGFYTTTLERQARQWAWNRFYKLQKGNRRNRTYPVVPNYPVVLRFRVRRYSLGNPSSALDRGLADLESLAFVIGDYNNEDFWSLVQHCRRSTPTKIHSHKKGGSGWYELVSGPVAAFWDQRVAMDDADQFSFHEKRGIDILNALINQGKGKGTNGAGDPDYYEWRRVR